MCAGDYGLGGSDDDRMPNLIGFIIRDDRDDGNMRLYESNPETLQIRSLVLSQNTGEIKYEKTHNLQSEKYFSMREKQLRDMITVGVFR